MSRLEVPKRGIAFELRPLRLREVGNPTWVDLEVNVQGPKVRPFVTSSATMTTADLSRLVARAKESSLSPETHHVVEGTDPSVVIEFREALGPDDVEVTVFVGEPYGMMEGRRFSVPGERLGAFADDLREELAEFGVHV